MQLELVDKEKQFTLLEDKFKRLKAENNDILSKIDEIEIEKE